MQLLIQLYIVQCNAFSLDYEHVCARGKTVGKDRQNWPRVAVVRAHEAEVWTARKTNVGKLG